MLLVYFLAWVFVLWCIGKRFYPHSFFATFPLVFIINTLLIVSARLLYLDYEFYRKGAVAIGYVTEVRDGRAGKTVTYSFTPKNYNDSYRGTTNFKDYTTQIPAVGQNYLPDSVEVVGLPVFVKYISDDPGYNELDKVEHLEITRDYLEQYRQARGKRGPEAVE